MTMFRFWVALLFAVLGVNAIFLANLDNNCLRCLCHAATSCNHTIECASGYCGPYWISHTYWVEAGQIVFPADDPKRNKAYEDCANSYQCAQNITKAYFRKFGRDCDRNGVTDCMDYIMIHFNGGYSCDKPLNREQGGREFLDRFRECRGF